MQSDELSKKIEKLKATHELTKPCRYCGAKPLFELDTHCNCLHSYQILQAYNDYIKASAHFGVRPTVIYYWNARNEKHNPFLEGK